MARRKIAGQEGPGMSNTRNAYRKYRVIGKDERADLKGSQKNHKRNKNVQRGRTRKSFQQLLRPREG